MVNEAVNGVILGIKVQNFFCHDNLEIDFNKSIKFIVGGNGSGKSAIFTALVVGLGGKAYNTNRAKKLQDYVKYNTNCATIEIKIKNSGDKAYKHREYGDHITIIRIIPKNGHPRYKVRSASGRERSATFEDIQEILMAHEIQIDNPISMLNQDEAKTFIQSDKTKLYNFFRRATNLAQSEREYLRARDKLKKAEEISEAKKKTCEDLGRKYNDLQHKEKQCELFKEYKIKKPKLERELEWRKIVEIEREVCRLKENYESKLKECTLLEQKLQDGPEDEAVRKLKEDLKEKYNEKENLGKQKHELAVKLDHVNTEYQKLESSKMKYLHLIKKEKQKVNEFERDIEDIMSGTVDRQRTQLTQSVLDAQSTLETTRAQLNIANDYEGKVNDEYCHVEEQVNNAQKEVRNLEAQLRSLTERKSELRDGTSSRSRYRERAMRLRERVQEADRRGKFRLSPRGPIGEYLEINDERWGSALEHILGAKIHSYCVNDSNDAKKLLQIIEEVYSGSNEPKPSVTCSEFLQRRHDVRRTAVRDSALDALRVSDDVVANFLIDELALETTMLVPQQKEALNLASDASRVPENCRRIVTQDCSECYPAPNFRSYGGRAKPATVLRVSTAHVLTQVEDEISMCKAALRSAQEVLQQRNSKAAEVRSAREAAREQRRKLAQHLLQVQRQHLAAQDSLQRCSEPQCAEREEELKISKQNLREMELKIEELQNKELENRQLSENIKDQLGGIQSQLKNITNTIESLRVQLEHEESEYDQSVRDRSSKMKEYTRTKAILDRLKEMYDSELPKKHATIKAMTKIAISRGEKINNPRSQDDIETELREVNDKIESFSRLQVSAEEVRDQLDQTMRAYKDVSDVLQQIDEFISEMTERVNKHLKLCQLRQNVIGRLVQSRFTQILKMRGIQGSLVIDHAAETLKFSSGHSASGGESTYSMVAFLVALWDCVDLPFFFMDEFDVFLDDLNRDKAIQLVLGAARERPARQFVFLTPHEPPKLREAPDLDINTMDVRR